MMMMMIWTSSNYCLHPCVSTHEIWTPKQLHPMLGFYLNHVPMGQALIFFFFILICFIDVARIYVTAHDCHYCAKWWRFYCTVHNLNWTYVPSFCFWKHLLDPYGDIWWLNLKTWLSVTSKMPQFPGLVASCHKLLYFPKLGESFPFP